MTDRDRFRKYGQAFERDEGSAQDSGESESPYEALPYVPPDKRALSKEEQEREELDELRGSKHFHYD